MMTISSRRDGPSTWELVCNKHARFAWNCMLDLNGAIRVQDSQRVLLHGGYNVPVNRPCNTRFSPIHILVGLVSSIP